MKKLRVIATILTSFAALAMASVSIAQHAYLAGGIALVAGLAFGVWMYRSPVAASIGLAALLGVGLAAKGAWTEASAAGGYVLASLVLQTLRRGENVAPGVPVAVR